MRIIEPYFEILNMPDNELILKHIETAARTCYKSENKITENSSLSLLKALLKSGHHSVFEHGTISVKIICDRGVSHQIVRHRLCAFSQESTRYCNYSKEKFGTEITVIKPYCWEPGSSEYETWLVAMRDAEFHYMNLINNGTLAEMARSVLPHSIKTEIVVTTNIREWRHILNLRCSTKSHPQIRQVMAPILNKFYKSIPILFEDLYQKYMEEINKWNYAKNASSKNTI